jgi:hypothetical protein
MIFQGAYKVAKYFLYVLIVSFSVGRDEEYLILERSKAGVCQNHPGPLAFLFASTYAFVNIVNNKYAIVKIAIYNTNRFDLIASRFL